MGLLLGVFVCEAGPHDSQKAPHVLQKLLGKVPRLKTVFADKGYEATPDGLIWRCFGWRLEVVRRDEDASGFDPIPRRWVIERTLSSSAPCHRAHLVIERTFGWFASWRRLGRPGHERHPESSEAMIKVGMSRLMISRIA
jgi:putative transposase